MPNRIPGKAIIAVIGTIVLLIVAFKAPTSEGVTAVAGADGTVDLVDGAAVVDPNVPGVTSPPESQPAVDLPAPTTGQQPAQVVVVSVDGGCETSDGTIRHFLDTGKQASARFTFFLSGLCLLPDDHKMDYHPPGKEPGQSDIPFADPAMVAERVQVFSDMYRSGHEIGTHFLGHFCSAGGVDAWTAEQWGEEISQAKQFLDTWPRQNPQAAGTGVLPFDSSVFKGDRTPCLLGQRPAMWEAFTKAGFRYDASDPGQLKWPTKVGGTLWEFPLPALKLAGTDKWVLSMDYNLLVNQTNGETEGDPDGCKKVEDQTYQTYMDALQAVHSGNRAPLILGSHLNDWQCNAYVNALERFVADVPSRFPDVRMISFADLADWLDKMDPADLQRLQALPEQRY